MAKPKEKKKPGKRWHYGMIIKVLRTFRIKKLWLNVDTGDYTWNALLFPAFYFLSGENRSLRINFQDDNEGVLMVQNRLYRIIHACISSYSKS